MELEKCGDADHSIEMQTALKRFEDVCNSLDDEHTKLLELEKRRQKLNEDLERLRNEIKEEKNYFRSVIDEQVAGERESDSPNYVNEQLLELVEPIALDTGAIKEFIETQRHEHASYENVPEIKNTHANLQQNEFDYTEEKPEENTNSELTADQMSLGTDDVSDA